MGARDRRPRSDPLRERRGAAQHAALLDGRSDADRLVPDVSVSLVNTNSRELLLACLESLASSDVEIVVLDNASEDGSAAAVRERFPEVRVIEQRHRAGFGANHNTVIRATTCRYVFVLNEDTTSEDWGFERMVAHLDANPRAAALGPRLVYPDGRLQDSAWRFPTPLVSTLSLATLGKLGVTQSHGDAPRAVDWVMGAAVVLRRSEERRGGRAVRRGLLPLFRRGGSAGPAAPRRLGGALLPAGDRRASRVAIQRRHPGAADQRDVAQPSPLLAQASQRHGRTDRGACDRRPVRGTRGFVPGGAARPGARSAHALARARCLARDGAGV